MKVTVKKPFAHGNNSVKVGDTLNMTEKEAMVYGKQGKVEPVGAEAKAEIKAAAKAGTESKTNKK